MFGEQVYDSRTRKKNDLMSLLINDEIIWISVPRCASHSIEYSLYNSNLNIEHFNFQFKGLKPFDLGFVHEHTNLYNMRDRWPNKKTLRIKRDWFDRWLSALEHIWFSIKRANGVPIIEYEEIDNEFIYQVFNKEFGNILYKEGGQYNIFKYLIKDFNLTEKFKEGTRTGLLWSQDYWLCGEKCDFEFDINNLDKFITFIEEKYGEKLTIERRNESKKKKNKIIVNDDLKNHIWEVFESPFNKVSKIF